MGSPHHPNAHGKPEYDSLKRSSVDESYLSCSFLPSLKPKPMSGICYGLNSHKTHQCLWIIESAISQTKNLYDLCLFQMIHLTGVLKIWISWSICRGDRIVVFYFKKSLSKWASGSCQVRADTRQTGYTTFSPQWTVHQLGSVWSK